MVGGYLETAAAGAVEWVVVVVRAATIIIGSEQAEGGVDDDIGIGIVDATSWHFWPNNGAGSSDPTATHNYRKR